jgi:putative N6-adenine-specific DNA methylase
MFAYQKTNRYFSQCADGLEALGAKELESLGATEVKKSFRGIYFSADRATLYRVNYMSRLVTRVLAPLLTFDCHSDRYLYKTAYKMEWDRLLSLETTFAIDANVTGSRIRHSQYAAQKLKDAIVDRFRDDLGERPSVEPRDPDIWLNLFIRSNKATISFDTSGGSLHRRGYRAASVEAPMQETVAAAIIRLTGWDGGRPLYDPMCGSGTLLAEAAMHYCRIPAGFLRGGFGFEGLPDFDQSVWKKTKQECDGSIRPLPPGLISGSDKSGKDAEAARRNCSLLPGGEKISIDARSFQKIGSLADTVIVCNPPYGVRLKAGEKPGMLLGEFAAFLRDRCSGADAYIYLGKEKLLGEIPLRATWKKQIKSGGLAGYLARYEIRGKEKEDG